MCFLDQLLLIYLSSFFLVFFGGGQQQWELPKGSGGDRRNGRTSVCVCVDLDETKVETESRKRRMGGREIRFTLATGPLV